jgi:hypothetical protein
MSLHIAKTFVVVADDCRADSAIVPASKGGKPTVAVLEYDLLSAHPYRYTLEDLIFEVHLAKASLAGGAQSARRRNPRRAFRALARLHARLAVDQELRLGRTLRRGGQVGDLPSGIGGI